MVTTAIFPLFYKNVIAASVPGAISTARLAFASSAFTLVVAVLATVLGPLADYESRKKRFFTAFFGLGVAATSLLAVRSCGPGAGGTRGIWAVGDRVCRSQCVLRLVPDRRHLARTHGPPVGGRLCLGLRGIDGSLRAVDGARQPRPRHRYGLADDRSAHRVPHRGLLVGSIHAAAAALRTPGALRSVGGRHVAHGYRTRQRPEGRSRRCATCTAIG